jgi:hypothetical protein
MTMENLWFRRKTYGWGWTPVAWQGWVVVFAHVAIVLASALTIDDDSPTREIMFTFVLPIALSAIALLRICYKKGEKPRWQWGKKDGSTN